MEELPALRRLAENTPTVREGRQESGRRVRCRSRDGGTGFAADAGNVHTPTMTLKTSALLALFGTILMTLLLVWNFVLTVLNVLWGLVPAVTLFQSFIYTFGCLTVAVFFYVFHRAQR